MLSYGCGQDSTAIAAKIIFDPTFRQKFAPKRLIAIFSDTGDEHPETYDYLEYFKEICRKNKIEFVHIIPQLGYHGSGWQSLRGFYRDHNACGSKAFPKTCTDRLKLGPIYGYLEDWLGTQYRVDVGRKQGFYKFAARYGKIRVLVGIAKGEERRVAKQGAEISKWKRETIHTVYPLIDIGFDRQACQSYIRSVGMNVPHPSNCRLCPFASEIELLWLARFLPDDYREWVEIERNKLNAFAHLGDRNLGVWGKKKLSEVLANAQQKYGHLTDQDLQDYKFSHGHCVMSVY